MNRQDFKKCAICGEGMMHNNAITFYRVTIEHMIFDTDAVKGLHHLEGYMGSPQLADVFNPKPKLAEAIDKRTQLVCQHCAMKPIALGILYEKE